MNEDHGFEANLWNNFSIQKYHGIFRKAKLNQCQNECSGLRDEVQELQLVRDDLQQYVRKLEQKNDDFERATRASLMSLEDFETRLNQAIERNAFLENELDEKENMAILIQRLKDEARDLKQELSVNETIRSSELPQTPPKTPENIKDSNKFFNEGTLNRARLSRNGTNFMSNASSIVPPSALNILGDLLKKVGVLESKLQSCRESIKDSSDNTGEKRVSITLTSTRVRHVNSTPVPTSLKDFIPLTA
ncbi:nuclear distribution protein nudE-like 1-A [Trichonephila clavata]|uniref:Nuclear distribution protein nudE-like 1-A n=1 Tax=Trichonephila clavata TaxID=2740835 RepID=A0A8X6KN44_TRICU|nr:nuclear distribution protein nudE-like 1-A [Trichonephila clavata]